MTQGRSPKFLPPLSGRHSSRATPSLRDAPTTASDNGNRQKTHLSNAGTCPDKPGQLFAPSLRALEPPANPARFDTISIPRK
jgi:hypothetical protein